MTDYNFAKNYENIKFWTYKKQTINFSEENNLFDKFLNILKSYPETFLFLKSQKILYIPASFVFAMVGVLEVVSLVPIINIKRLEKNHFEYEQKVNALSEINRDREEKFSLLKDHSSLLTNPSPSYLFGYYLQKSIPKNVRLKNYLVDNNGFIIDAISKDLVAANKLISLLMQNRLIDNKTMKVNRIINKSNDSGYVSIQISGKLVYLPLKDKIQSYKEAEDYGNFSKLSDFVELLDLIK